MPYTPTTAAGRTELTQFGISAGTFEDGTEAYIGAGPNPDAGCVNENPCPARRE